MIYYIPNRKQGTIAMSETEPKQDSPKQESPKQERSYDPAELLGFFLDFSSDEDEVKFLEKMETNRQKIADIILEATFAINKQILFGELIANTIPIDQTPLRQTMIRNDKLFKELNQDDSQYGYYFLNEDTTKIADRMKEYRNKLREIKS